MPAFRLSLGKRGGARIEALATPTPCPPLSLPSQTCIQTIHTRTPLLVEQILSSVVCVFMRRVEQVVLRRGCHVSALQAHGGSFLRRNKWQSQQSAVIQRHRRWHHARPAICLFHTLCPPLPSLDRTFHNVPFPAIPTACWRRVPCASPPHCDKWLSRDQVAQCQCHSCATCTTRQCSYIYYINTHTHMHIKTLVQKYSISPGTIKVLQSPGAWCWFSLLLFQCVSR